MSKSVYELIFNLLILTSLAFFVVKAFTLTGGAGRVPLFVGIPTLLLMCFKIVMPLTKKRSLNTQGDQFTEQSKAPKSAIGDASNRILIEIIWLFVFTSLIVLLGVIYGSLVFLFMYLRLHNKDAWIFSIAMSITVVLGAYLVFQLALKIQLYEGVLPGIIFEWLDY